MYEENEKDLKSALSYYERCFKIFEMVCFKEFIFPKESYCRYVEKINGLLTFENERNE